MAKKRRKMEGTAAGRKEAKDWEEYMCESDPMYRENSKACVQGVRIAYDEKAPITADTYKKCNSIKSRSGKEACKDGITGFYSKLKAMGPALAGRKKNKKRRK